MKKILGVTILTAAAAFAQGQSNKDDGTFVLNGHAWASKQAFIESGARCGSKNFNEDEANDEEEKLKGALKKVGRDIASPFKSALKSITIPVYWHTIKNTAGDGTIPDQQITDQIQVLNAAYANT